jgi:hypothetical protein
VKAAVLPECSTLIRFVPIHSEAWALWAAVCGVCFCVSVFLNDPNLTDAIVAKDFFLKFAGVMECESTSAWRDDDDMVAADEEDDDEEEGRDSPGHDDDDPACEVFLQREGS